MDDVHFCFVWQNTALADSDFLKAIYLELKTDNSEEMNRDWAFDSFTWSMRQLHDTDPWLKKPGEQLLGELSRAIRHSEYAQTPVDVSQTLNQLASLRSSIDVPSFQAART